jgi:hypothetical protein
MLIKQGVGHREIYGSQVKEGEGALADMGSEGGQVSALAIKG